MSPRILVIDNYDSFTYNLVQYLRELGAICDVSLNDQVDGQALTDNNWDGVLLSPGPGTPDTAGITLESIGFFAGKVPIFGVCLGHQSIAQHFGASVVRASRLMHGKTSPVYHQELGVFQSLPSPIVATRYHSLLVEPESVPACLEITAQTKEGEIMGLRHRALDIEGVQFHPESILTTEGMPLLKNWMLRLGQGQ